MRGLSGSGKSYLAKQLAEDLPAIHLNSDIIRKAIAGYAPLSRTKANLGEGIYTPKMSYKTYQSLLEKAETALKSGVSVVVDATFLHPKSLAKQQKIAQNLKLPFIIIDIQVSITCLRLRVAKRFSQGNDPSEADIAVLEQQVIHYHPLKKTDKHVLSIHNENGFEYSTLKKRLSTFPYFKNNE
jgi:predicted kinase